MSEYDATALISDIRERGSLPANDVRFTSTSILSAATKELREGCAPLLSQARTEHLVYPYSQAVASGTATYRMPPRAVGGSLRDVTFIRDDGTEIPLDPLSADDARRMNRADATGTPCAYWLQGYKVVLVPTPNITGTLSTPYYARPNFLVLPSAVATCDDVTRVGTSYTIIFNDDPPAGLDVDTIIDVVRATPGLETLAAAVPVTVQLDTPSSGFTTYTFSSDSTEIATGDYICIAGQAPVPQLPVEMHGLLGARTTRRLLKAVGDDRWQALEADVAELEDRAKNWLAPRVAGDTEQAGGSIGSNGIVPMGWAWRW